MQSIRKGVNILDWLIFWNKDILKLLKFRGKLRATKNWIRVRNGICITASRDASEDLFRLTQISVPTTAELHELNYQCLGRAIGRRPLRDFYTGEIRFQLIDKAYYSLCLNYKVNIFAVKDGRGSGQGSIRTRLGRLTSYDDGTSFGDGGKFINEVR